MATTAAMALCYAIAYELHFALRFLGHPTAPWLSLYLSTWWFVCALQAVALGASRHAGRGLPARPRAFLDLGALSGVTALAAFAVISQPGQGYSSFVFVLDWFLVVSFTVLRHAPFVKASVKPVIRTAVVATNIAEVASRRFVLAADATLLLLIATGLFIGPLLAGEAVSPADLTFHFQPWYSESVEKQSPQNGDLYDEIFATYTREYLVREQWREGHLPLWSSNIGSGTPLLAAENIGTADPFNLATIWAPPPYLQLWLGRSVLKLLVAGLGTYVLLWSFGLSRVSRLFGSVSFMMSSFLVQFLMLPHSSVVVFLPWLYWAEWNLARVAAARARLGWAALVASFTGAHILAGQPEMTVLITASAVAWYAVLSFRQSLRASISSLAWLAGSLFWGYALGAIQLVPGLELVASGAYAERTGVGQSSYLDAAQAILWFIPDYFGGPTANFTPFGKYPLRESSYYVGVGALVFAVLAVVRWRQHGPTGRFIVSIMIVQLCLALGIAYHMPLLDRVGQLPVLSNILLHRVALLGAFSVCILAAFGLDATSRRNRERPSESLRSRRAALVTAASVIAAALPLDEGRRSLITSLPATVFQMSPTNVYQLTWGIFAVALGAEFLKLVIWSHQSSGTISARLCVALAVLDLAVVQFAYWPHSNTSWHIPPTDLTDQLGRLTQGAVPVRISSAGIVLPPNTSSVFGLYDLRAFTLPVPPYLAEFWAAAETTRDPAIGSVFRDLYFMQAGSDPALLSHAGVRYYVSPSEYAPVLAAANTALTGTLIDLSAGRQDMEFVSSRDDLDAVGILLNTYGRQAPNAAVHVDVIGPDGRSVARADTDAITSGWVKIQFDPARYPAGSAFRMQLSTDLPPGTVATYATVPAGEEQLTVDGRLQAAALAFTASSPAPPWMSRVATSGPMDVWRIEAAAPYFRLAANSVSYAAPSQGLAAERQSNVDSVLVSTTDGVRIAGGNGHVQEVTYAPGHATARVDVREAPMIAVIQESNVPGWTARVDGVTARIIAADILYQGVVVPPGEHNVAFDYEPAGLDIGAALTGAAALLVGFAMIVALAARQSMRSRRDLSS